MRVGVVLVAIAVGAVPARAEPAIEGRITVGRILRDSVGAAVIFTRSPFSGAPLGTDGPCALYASDERERFSAGTISITGTAEPITLEESRADGVVKYRSTTQPASSSFVPGAQITATTSGGVDVPGFTLLVTAPPALTGFSPPASMSRAGYTATWTANSGTHIRILILAFAPAEKGAALVTCSVADTGRFTVPASTFALFPPTFDHAIVTLVRVAETVQDVGDARVALDAVQAASGGPFPLTAEGAQPRVRCETSPHWFLSIAVGLGGVSRNGDVPPTDSWALRVQVGQRLKHGLHLIEDTSVFTAGYITPYSTYSSEEHWSFGAGVRWTPFEPAPRPFGGFPGPFIDTRAFYLTALLGADLRNRVGQSSATEEIALSPMASLAVGLLEFQGHGWSLGPEFREQLAYYDGHLQRGWMLLFATHLNDW